MSTEKKNSYKQNEENKQLKSIEHITKKDVSENVTSRSILKATEIEGSELPSWREYVNG